MHESPHIWTVGHSNHALETFEGMLEANGIEYVVDVRSYPYSKFVSQFDRENLEGSLRSRGFKYLYLGRELGGRPEDQSHFDDEGRALYDRMAATNEFRSAIDRLVDGSNENQIAIMCSCGKPDECHRRLLVGRVLAERGIELRHVLPNWEVITERTVDVLAGKQDSLFGSEETAWRSTQSVSHRRRLSTSSHA